MDWVKSIFYNIIIYNLYVYFSVFILPSKTTRPILMKFFVSLCVSGSLDGLYSQLYPVSPTRRVPQTGILRFMEEIFAYKWSLLVIEEIIGIS